MATLLRQEEKKDIEGVPKDILFEKIEKEPIAHAKYGYCPSCRVALEYNSDTDEIYCPVCGVVYDDFVEPHAEVKYAKPEPEEEDIQIHRRLRPQDIYSIDSNIRRRHLDDATMMIKRAAKALGFSEDHPIVKTAVDILARYIKHQKTRSDSLEVSAYAALLIAARINGYAIVEESLLRTLNKYPSDKIRRIAKQIRSKRRNIAETLKISTTTSVIMNKEQPIKLLEIYRSKMSTVEILRDYEGAIIKKAYEIWKKAKHDLEKLNKTAKTIATALTYVAAILVLPETRRVKLRQFDISDIFHTTPITIREVLPTLMKYLTKKEQELVKKCMRRGRRSLKKKTD